MQIEQLYIRESEHVDGPYDMMAVIRKIRNGVIKHDTLVSLSPYEEPAAASSIEALAALLEEESANIVDPATISGAAPAAKMPRPSKEFLGLLTGTGLDFLRSSLSTTIYTGVFILIWILIGAGLIYNGTIVSTAMGIVACYFLLGGYLYGVLRFVRGNPVNAGAIIGRMKQTMLQMLILGLIVGMLMMPSLALLLNDLIEARVVIGLPVLFLCLFVAMTFLAFAPLLVMEKGLDFWDAICESARVVSMKQNIGVVFGLITLNFILLPFLPIILPMTMGALVELFEDFYTYG